MNSHVPFLSIFLLFSGFSTPMLSMQSQKRAGSPNYSFNLLILRAAQQGDLNKLRVLLENQNQPVDAIVDDIYGMNPLHWAAYKGHVDIVRYLVAVHNADIHAYTKTGLHPLYLAVAAKQIAVVRCLIEECNAQITEPIQKGSSAYAQAISSGNCELIWLAKRCQKAGPRTKRYARQMPRMVYK